MLNRVNEFRETEKKEEENKMNKNIFIFGCPESHLFWNNLCCNKNAIYFIVSIFYMSLFRKLFHNYYK